MERSAASADPGAHAPVTWDFSCRDWAARLAEGRSLVPNLPLNRGEAIRAVKIFNRLRLPDVPGLPRMEDAAGDWFRDIVAAILGSFDPVANTRGVPDAFILVPKKNSKTTGAAGLMVTALLVNRRPNALFGLFGPTQEVADIAFQTCVGMIEADPDLRKLLKPRDHLKRIEHLDSGAELRITTFDPAVATGGKFAGWLLDELHELGTASYASRVLTQLRGARAAVPESFGVIITTQSAQPPAGAFRTELKLARAVRDGTVTDVPLLPVLYEFPEDVQTDPAQPWRNPDLWPMVTPNIGRSVNIGVIEALYNQARAKGIEEERIWASQHLNVQIGMALHDDRWSGADHWEAAGDPTLTLDRLMAECEVATVGIDGGGLDDLLGLAVIGRHRETKRWWLWTHAWADAEVLRRRKEIAERLEDFVRDGDLDIVELRADDSGSIPDLSALAAIVLRLYEAGLLPEQNAVGLDAAGMPLLVDELVRHGVPFELLYSVPQGYRLNGIVKMLPRKLKERSLRHGASRLMAWCVGNAKSTLRGSAEVIEKAVAGKAKIDPLIAAFNAGDGMARNPEAVVTQSFWQTDAA